MSYLIVCDHEGCDAVLSFPLPRGTDAVPWLLVPKPKFEQIISFYIFESANERPLTAGIPDERHYCPEHVAAYRFLAVLSV